MMASLSKAAALQGVTGPCYFGGPCLRANSAAVRSCGVGPVRGQSVLLQKDLFGEALTYKVANVERNKVRENNGGATCQSHEGGGMRSMAGDFTGGDSSVLNSFGNECTIIKSFKQELEKKEAYQQLQCSLSELEESLERLVKEEKYEEAIELRDRVRMLALQKRMMEISVQPQTQYRVGDVIVHKKYGYRGVIYGHDLECAAPEGWQQQMKIDSLPEGRKQPFYHVLVDVRDRPGAMSTYVAQENMTVQPTARPVLHPWTNMFFTSFEDGQYLPTKKLRSIYPDDW